MALWLLSTVQVKQAAQLSLLAIKQWLWASFNTGIILVSVTKRHLGAFFVDYKY